MYRYTVVFIWPDAEKVRYNLLADTADEARAAAYEQLVERVGASRAREATTYHTKRDKIGVR
jgi:hypothetical protein